MTEKDARRDRIKRSIMRTITNPGERSAQSSIGPSEIAKECDYCVGRALTRKYPELWWEATTFSEKQGHKAWIGIAIHEKLERDHDEGLKESRLFITHLEGYGDIYGHSDLYQDSTAIDYKTKDLSAIDKIRLHGPPPSEVFQIFLYGHGQLLAGRSVEDVALVYIPRDSNDSEEVEVVFAEYNPEVARKALERLERIWTTVRSGQGATLERGDDCYVCTRSRPSKRWW